MDRASDACERCTTVESRRVGSQPTRYSIDASLRVGQGPTLHAVARRHICKGEEMMATEPAQALKEFQPQHEFFVGIDSDGCAFDTMGLKQRECFCPWMIGCFGLQPVAQAVRECREFADLSSRTRGVNRHKTLKRILVELLPSHPAVKSRKFKVPQFPHYFAWVDDPASVLSNEGLKQAIAKAESEAKKELEIALKWSERVNWAIQEIVKGVPPFPLRAGEPGEIAGQGGYYRGLRHAR